MATMDAGTVAWAPEDGITASTNGQGSPSSAHRFNSRLNCGYVKTPNGMSLRIDFSSTSTINSD
jgi:hypothetical protein